MPTYNQNNNRFLQAAQDSRKGAFESVGAASQIYQFLGDKNGSLLGNFATQGSQPAFSSLAEAEKFRNANRNDTGVQDLINKAYKGVAPDDYAKKASNFLEQNVEMPGQEGQGLLGGLQQMGTGLNTLTGGYAEKVGDYAMEKVGNYAMDKLGGQAIKDFGTKAVSKIAESAVGQGLGAVASGLMSVAGPAMMAKQIYDFANQTVDAYEGYEQGLKNAAFTKKDYESQRNTGKANMLYKNREIANAIDDRRGVLSEHIGSKAEQVISAGNKVASKSNMETIQGSSENVKKDKQGLVTAYMENSRALNKQKENLQYTNIDSYSRMNQGLMQEESALQENIDEMDQSRKDMKGMYQVSKALGV